MQTFNNIKELIDTLHRERDLISEMFSKRKAMNFKLSHALSIVDDENRLNALLEHSVLRQSDEFLEIDAQYLDFFEEILDVNEDINLSYIDENIKTIKNNIQYYFGENSESRKYGYLRNIKKIFRKIGIITLKSVIDLRRNIENTFKNEPNYKNKQLKLTHLDEKRNSVNALINLTLQLVNKDELLFFNTATDEELRLIINELKYGLNDCLHNLIEIEKQIIDYLNQIKVNGAFLEKVRKLKYLRDQFRIEAETDIRAKLSDSRMILFEKRVVEPLKLSIDYLRDDEVAFKAILKVVKQKSIKSRFTIEIAGAISDDYLGEDIEEEVIVNFEEMMRSFSSKSENLFNFIINYEFGKKMNFEDKVTIFCQIASQFEQDLRFEDSYQVNNGIEYCLIYPK